MTSQKTPASGKGTKVFDSMEKQKQRQQNIGCSPFESLQKKMKVFKNKKNKVQGGAMVSFAVANSHLLLRVVM